MLIMVGIFVFSFLLFKLRLFPRIINGPKELTVPSVNNIRQVFSEKPGFVLSETNKHGYASLTTAEIWKKLLLGFEKGEKVQVYLENELIERLRNEPDSPVYKELLSLFRQGSLPNFAQQVLVSILGQVGNFKSAEALMSLVNENLLNEPDVKLVAFNAISQFSPESRLEHSSAELAPVFEIAWQTDNSEYWPSIANVMASIGTPSTLDVFTKTLTDNTDPKRVEIVKQAMTSLSNPDLVPKLAASLENPENENVLLASGNALANIGNSDATSALLEWSAQANTEKAALVKEWFETAMNTTPEFIDYLKINLTEQKFESPEIKQAVQELLKNVKSQ